MKLARYKNHRLVRNALVTVAIVVVAKFVVHELHWEVITLNPLVTGLIAANVFLMGFLLSGVLSDYKESEKLPGELAACLETITDEALTSWTARKDENSRTCLRHLDDLVKGVLDWFNGRQATAQLMEQIIGLNRFYAAYESYLPANFVVRLRQEQANLRRMLIRANAIRETSFIPSGYVISEVVTLLLLTGLVLARVEPFHDSLFCIGLITFLFSFLGLLIRDLDNPFGYGDAASTEDVSLKPLQDTAERLRALHAAAPGAADAR